MPLFFLHKMHSKSKNFAKNKDDAIFSQILCSYVTENIRKKIICFILCLYINRWKYNYFFISFLNRLIMYFFWLFNYLNWSINILISLWILNNRLFNNMFILCQLRNAISRNIYILALSNNLYWPNSVLISLCMLNNRLLDNICIYVN